MKRHKFQISCSLLRVILGLIFVFLFSNISFAFNNYSLLSVEDNLGLIHNDNSCLLSSAHHPNEIPEASDEAPVNNNEKPSERDSEDDRDDELFGFDFSQLLQVKMIETVVLIHSYAEIAETENIPFYILFHSWKSFLL